MNKTELAAKIAEKTGLSKKDAVAALNAFTETITEELIAGNAVQMIGFGTFSTTEVAEKTARSPLTGEKLTVPAHRSPKFKFGLAVKNAVK